MPCEHLDVILLEEIPERQLATINKHLNKEYKTLYSGLCLNCGTNLVRTFIDYKQTKKLYDNTYNIYKKQKEPPRPGGKKE